MNGAHALKIDEPQISKPSMILSKAIVKNTGDVFSLGNIPSADWLCYGLGSKGVSAN